MAIREVDAISDAIIETEKEIAGDAWGNEDTGALDETGDRSLEDIGEGLEGQQEPEDDDDTEGEDADGEAEAEGEGEGETAEAEAAKAAAAAAAKAAGEVQPEGRIPSGKYREVSERARAAEAERDALKAQIEKTGGENKSLADKLDLVMREINDLKRAPRGEVKPPEPVAPTEPPDQF